MKNRHKPAKTIRSAKEWYNYSRSMTKSEKHHAFEKLNLIVKRQLSRDMKWH